jgi:subtilase family serine protease
MKLGYFIVAAMFVAALALGCGADSSSGSGEAANDAADAQSIARLEMSVAPYWEPTVSELHEAVCQPAAPGEARCHAHVIVDESGSPKATVSTPSGYGPTQLRGAYGLTGSATGVPIIALVDAYDDPNAFADLNTYSTTYGLPTLATCPASPWPPTAPCFRKVNESGGSTPPRANSGWSLEISLDVQVAHAMCQNCVILLVEANSANYSDLMAGVDRARLLGATAISNSYGGSESSGETSYDSHFNYPGIAFTVSTGDNGYGVEYPSSSPYVTAVGGTTLTLSGTTYVSEAAWVDGGSGCSKYEPQPSFQTALKLAGCSKRMVADVAADADPNTGAAIYDSYGYNGQKGWFQVGGTSLASPLVAAVYALAGVPATAKANTLPYSLGNYSTTLHDVTTGDNGTCSPAYLCTAEAGYDGPTGLGSPKGLGAF